MVKSKTPKKPKKKVAERKACDLHVRISSKLKTRILEAAKKDRRNISNWIENMLWIMTEPEPPAPNPIESDEDDEWQD